MTYTHVRHTHIMQKKYVQKGAGVVTVAPFNQSYFTWGGTHRCGQKIIYSHKKSSKVVQASRGQGSAQVLHSSALSALFCQPLRMKSCREKFKPGSFLTSTQLADRCTKWV